LTVEFKEGLAARLPVLHPARWVYTGVNGWLLPFVLNQSDLNFGRHGLLDTAVNWPLGTASCAVLLVVLGVTLRYYGRVVLARGREECFSSASFPALGSFLALTFVATGLAIYFESFLYSPMVIPVLMVCAVRALTESKIPAWCFWVISIIWIANAGQQVQVFRAALSQIA